MGTTSGSLIQYQLFSMFPLTQDCQVYFPKFPPPNNYPKTCSISPLPAE